eukprot:5188343-Lingulodinium_polyedra.AAC.1
MQSSRQAMGLLRSQAMKAPEPPPMVLIKELEEMPVQGATVRSPRPGWLSPLCHMRSELYLCGIRLTLPDGACQ